MKNSHRKFCLGICLSLFLSSAVAEVAPPPKANKNTSVFWKDNIALSVFADELIAYGEGKKDPLALLIAAKIKKNIKWPSDASDHEESDKAELQALVDQAKTMAGEKEEVLKLVEQTEKIINTRVRGLVDDTLKQIVSSVPPNGTVTRKLDFRGSEYTMIGLLLDASRITGHKRNDYDLDLYVRSAQGGATICSMEGPGIPEKCAWTPERTGGFIIDLVNRTSLDTPFIMLFR